MTTTEFSNEFDILYNSIATMANPGLDVYEKSVYLTKAQLEIVKNHYNMFGNKYQRGFEGSEKRRVDLKELIKNYISVNPITNDNKISDNSKFYVIPNDVFLIVFEKAFIEIPGCTDSAEVKVIPKTHDEYNIQINNPFKKPNRFEVWRLDFSKQGDNKVVELVSEYNIDRYQLRYLKYPKPIILSDLDLLYPTEDLSIDGETAEQTCELDESIHREILDRAVELALLDYKPSNLQNKVELDQRNE